MRKSVLKGISGKSTDARSGFGRIKDAVGRRGFRGHQSKHSVDDAYLSNEGSTRNSEDLRRSFEMPFNLSQLEKHLTDLVGPNASTPASAKTAQTERKPGEEAAVPKEVLQRSSHSSVTDLETPATNVGSDLPGSDYMELINHANGITAREREREDVEESRRRSQLMLDGEAMKKMEHFDWASSQLPRLRSTRSQSHLTDKTSNMYWEHRWPRNMSFTAMIDVVAASQPKPLTADEVNLTSKDPDAALAFENDLASQNRIMEAHLQHLKTFEVPWIEAKLAQIEAYDQQCGRDQSKLDMVYHHKLEEHHALQDASEELLSQERAALTEANKDIETLGAKLEYELSALQSKVEEVEDGVAEFDRQVKLIESRVKKELSRDERLGGPKEGWIGWLFRMSM